MILPPQMLASQVMTTSSTDLTASSTWTTKISTIRSSGSSIESNSKPLRINLSRNPKHLRKTISRPPMSTTRAPLLPKNLHSHLTRWNLTLTQPTRTAHLTTRTQSLASANRFTKTISSAIKDRRRTKKLRIIPVISAYSHNSRRISLTFLPRKGSLSFKANKFKVPNGPQMSLEIPLFVLT